MRSHLRAPPWRLVGLATHCSRPGRRSTNSRLWLRFDPGMRTAPRSGRRHSISCSRAPRTGWLAPARYPRSLTRLQAGSRTTPHATPSTRIARAGRRRRRETSSSGSREGRARDRSATASSRAPARWRSRSRLPIRRYRPNFRRPPPVRKTAARWLWPTSLAPSIRRLMSSPDRLWRRATPFLRADLPHAGQRGLQRLQRRQRRGLGRRRRVQFRVGGIGGLRFVAPRRAARVHASEQLREFGIAGRGRGGRRG